MRYKTSIDKEPLNQFSHKPPFEQTQYYQSEVLTRENTHAISDHLSPQSVDIGQPNQFPSKQSLEQVPSHQNEVLAKANNLIGSDQLPPNPKLRERSTIQAISSRDYPLHLNEAQRITREQSRENAKQTREYLTPHYSETIPNSKPIKKSVHFRDSVDGQDHNYDPKGYNPILITPRPSYSESSRNGLDRPKGIISPKPWLDGKGKYFMGTVENGQGGDFYRYYFSPTSPINPITRERYVPTSTPNVNDNYPDQSVLSRQTELIVPQKLFPTSEEVNFPRERPSNESERMENVRNQYYTARNINDDINSNHITEAHTNKYPPRKSVTAHRFYSNQTLDLRKMTVDSFPEPIPPRAGYSNSISSGKYRKSPSYPIPKREYFKHEDGDECPLPNFTEPPITHNNTKIKVDPNWMDSDQDIGSDNETYLRTPPSEPRKEMNSILDSSQQVGEVLTQLVEHQKVLQDKNLKIMEKLINKSTNSFVLDDIPVFDGLKGSIDFEMWLLELDKAVEITGMNVSELAFSKSSGTPHKMIRRLRREKSWEYIKEKLQITYSKLATDVHASTDLNQNKQKCHEPLEDFIERFYQNYK